MPTDVTSFENQQTLQVQLSATNRLYIMTGIAKLMTAAPMVPDVFRFLVGPQMTHQQFVTAVVMASPSKVLQAGSALATGQVVDFEIASFDADWDDESGQVQVRVEIASANVMVVAVAYQVTLLAEMQAD